MAFKLKGKLNPRNDNSITELASYRDVIEASKAKYLF
jgi:hypothetical protein